MLQIKKLNLIDPTNKEPLFVKSSLRHPKTKKTWYGVLRNKRGDAKYSIAEGVIRIVDPNRKYATWIDKKSSPKHNTFQNPKTVEFFAFEWFLFPNVNNEKELKYRTEGRYKINLRELKNKLILDAGAGSGDESSFFLKHGAKVVSIDLSDSIDVASKRLGENENWIGVQGDITKLPFDNETFDLVYCEGVLQHTRNTKAALKELTRVLKIGGQIAAWHYGLPEKMPWYMKLFHNIRVKRRKRFRKWDRHIFIAYTAFLTSLGYLPLLGRLLAFMKFISRKKYNRSFQANWAMTMDALGWHRYQRFMTRRKFLKIVKELGNFEVIYEDSVNPIINYKKVNS